MAKFPFYFSSLAFCATLFTTPITSAPTKADQAETLYRAILKNGWLEEKKELGRRLGKIGSRSETLILKLFQAESYWDREAGINAAKEVSLPKIDQALVKLYLEDHMTQDSAKETLISHINRYVSYLILEWDSERSAEDRITLIFALILRTQNSVLS